MNKKLTLIPLLAILLSCGQKPYEYRGLEAYTRASIRMDRGEFDILQITDTHWGVGTNFEREEAFIAKLIDNSNPDMIVLGGDMFMHANPKIVDRFFTFIDSFDIPFCYTYGNHDLQGFYKSNYIENVIKSCANSYLINLDDGLPGKSNYYVNIENSAGEVVWQIIVMDSNSYVQSGNYDIFHPEQVKWYESIIKDTEDKEGKGKPINSLAFYHIPGYYFEEAWNKYVTENPDYTCTDPDGYGCDREGVAYGYADDGLFDKMQELGSTKGIFVGHDHINNYRLDYTRDDNLEPIKLCYNLKCGENIYHDDSLLGGQIIKINEDGVTFEVKREYLTFEEVEA